MVHRMGDTYYMSNQPTAERPAYRAGLTSQRVYFDTLGEAARYVRANGGPLARLSGKVYRSLSVREIDAILAELSD